MADKVDRCRCHGDDRGEIMLSIANAGCEVVHRRCGGWLAYSSRGQPLRIGVTARTEGEAVKRYQAAVAEWLSIIGAERRGSPMIPCQANTALIEGEGK